MHCEIALCAPDDIVVQKGHVATGMYFITRGKLVVLASEENVWSSAPSFIGDMCLFKDMQRSSPGAAGNKQTKQTNNKSNKQATKQTKQTKQNEQTNKTNKQTKQNKTKQNKPTKKKKTYKQTYQNNSLLVRVTLEIIRRKNERKLEEKPLNL